MKVIRVDNFGRDDMPEYQVSNSGLTKDEAEAIAKRLNAKEPEYSQDFYRVVEDSHVLCRGFDP